MGFARIREAGGVGPRVPGGAPGLGVVAPPTCRRPSAVTTRPFQQCLLRTPPSSEWGPARAAGACLHQGDRRSGSRGPHPAGDARPSGDPEQHPGRTWGGSLAGSESWVGWGFPGLAHGAGPSPGTNGALVCWGWVRLEAWHPGSHSCLSGTLVPSASSGPSGSRGSLLSGCVLRWVSERPATPGR